MNLKILKSKKVILALVSIILVLIALEILLCFNFFSKKQETSAQPVEEEMASQEANGEYIDINELEESQENVIDESVENKEKDNNTTKQNKNENTNKNTSKNTKDIPYYIKVNYGAQVVTIYKKDENGEYTVPIKAMVCSTGTYTPTSGTYSIPARWKWLGLQGGVYGQYCTQIKGNILFHSVPYLRKGDPASLEYWEYDKLGTYASAGCIRLTVKDAKWIYDNCAKGTKVEFYSSSNPGPLGKPSAKKISSYSDNLRNWDPTDPNPDNPWNNNNKEENTNNGANLNNTVNTNKVDTNNVVNENNTVNTNKVDTNNIVNVNNTINTNKVDTNNVVNSNNSVNTNKVNTNNVVNGNNTVNTNKVDTNNVVNGNNNVNTNRVNTNNVVNGNNNVNTNKTNTSVNANNNINTNNTKI